MGVFLSEQDLIAILTQMQPNTLHLAVNFDQKPYTSILLARLWTVYDANAPLTQMEQKVTSALKLLQ